MLRYEEEQSALLRMILKELQQTNDNLEELNKKLSYVEYSIKRDE